MVEKTVSHRWIMPLPTQPVHLLPHLPNSFCNHTYPSQEELSSKRPLAMVSLRSSWPYNGTPIVTFFPFFSFFFLFWLLSLKIIMTAFFSQLHSSFHLFHYLFCVPTLSLLSCLLLNYTLSITLLPSTFLHVKTLSCDPECLDIACKKNSWSIFFSK